MTVVHVVLFKFKPGADGLEVLKGIATLKDKAPGVQSVQLGVNFNSASKGFTHGFTMTFKDRDALKEYDQSEAHVNFLKNHSGALFEDVLIFDYDIEDFSVPRPQL
ncbi:hypothetical protein EDD11_006601 [Mortierella claussenii]|nr:hypothetical protein EDD11_006601 [Mortierella claussenii]